MPDLTINLPSAAPAPAASNSSAGASSSADAARGANGAETSGSEASFASTLKSKMDKSAAKEKTTSSRKAEDGKESADAKAAAAPTEALPGAGATDLAALLPLLAAANAAPAPDPKLIGRNVADTALSGRKSSAELTQLSAAEADTKSLLPLAMATTAQSGGQQAAHDNPQDKAPAGPAPLLKPAADGNALGSGKGKGEAAISAEMASLPTATESARDLSAQGDFRAQLERAGAALQVGQRPPPDAGASLRIDTPVGQAGWHEDMGQKLTWMVGNNRQQADLVLTPPQLGRIEVSLTMHGDQAQAIFTSLNPQVREALEDSLPRLREILADAGVTLGQTQVGSESPNQSSNPGEKGDNSRFGRSDGGRYAADAGRPVAVPVPVMRSGRGMVDVFA